MEDSKLISELVEALNSIQTELHYINKTLSTIAAQSSRPASSSEPAARPMGRGPGRPSTSRGPVSRGPRTGGYSRSESGGYGRSEGGSSAGEGDAGSRFPKKKGPGRPTSGKPPAKKGGGYPKKSR